MSDDNDTPAVVNPAMAGDGAPALQGQAAPATVVNPQKAGDGAPALQGQAAPATVVNPAQAPAAIAKRTETVPGTDLPECRAGAPSPASGNPAAGPPPGIPAGTPSCTPGDTPGAVLTTTVDNFVNWFREGSIWYLLFATACCGIELMQTGGPRTDLDRFGAVFRTSPRQSDLLIVAGTITYKMADRVRLIYAQMAEPKYVIAMGSCANCGGLFQRGYSVVPGVDSIVPVDIYLPGCPPRPEALNEAILRLQDLIHGERWADKIKGNA